MKALTIAALLLLQSQPAFDAASVKALPESAGWPPRADYWVSPHLENAQRFRAQTRASNLIEWAFQLRDFQVTGGPQWTTDYKTRIQVQATTATPATEAEMRKMMQTLLADRFRLMFHRERREMAVFALQPAQRVRT